MTGKYITTFKSLKASHDRPWLAVGPVFSGAGKVFGVAFSAGPYGLAVHRSIWK